MLTSRVPRAVGSKSSYGCLRRWRTHRCSQPEIIPLSRLADCRRALRTSAPPAPQQGAPVTDRSSVPTWPGSRRSTQKIRAVCSQPVPCPLSATGGLQSGQDICVSRNLRRWFVRISG